MPARGRREAVLERRGPGGVRAHSVSDTQKRSAMAMWHLPVGRARRDLAEDPIEDPDSLDPTPLRVSLSSRASRSSRCSSLSSAASAAPASTASDAADAHFWRQACVLAEKAERQFREERRAAVPRDRPEDAPSEESFWLEAIRLTEEAERADASQVRRNSRK